MEEGKKSENLEYCARKLDICQICENKFNVGERIPRILVNCGHTFCTKCLGKCLVNFRIRCGICSKLMKNLDSVERLPLNINILDEIVSNDPILNSVYFDEDEEDESKFCELHQQRINHFFCSNHRTVFCRECIRTLHVDQACFVVDLYEIQKMKQIHSQNTLNNSLQVKRSQQKNCKPETNSEFQIIEKETKKEKPKNTPKHKKKIN